jgi:uncharacterized protein (TIGR00730 family)
MFSLVKTVCIFGSCKDLSQETKQEIVRLGELLAQKGVTVMSGGFGGTMEDISRGAKSAGGKTVGVTCYVWDKGLYTKANKFVDEEIVADSLLERIDLMLKEADAFVVLPGGTGTLLELSATLEHINKGLIKPKPIIIFGDFWKPVLSCLKNEPIFSKKTQNACNLSHCTDLVTFVSTIDECIEKLK